MACNAIIQGMKEWVVPSSSEGQRIEKFVRKVLNEAPLSFIYKAFRKKDVKINGHWVKKDAIVHEGDTVRVYVTDEQLKDFSQEREVEKKELDVPIIYEDDNILILDKPAGLLVTGDEGEKRNTLSRKVLDYLYLKGEFDPKEHSFVPSPAHRLDRNTGGLVVFGKTDAALKELEEAFKERVGLEKHYLALVVGDVAEGGDIEAPLKKDTKMGLVKVTPVKEGGKSAHTIYKVKERFGPATLFEVDLLTGRTHQIRVHMAYIKHPIVGDGKYGDFQENRKYNSKYGFNRQFLRAYSLTFKGLKAPLDYLSNRTFHSHLSEDELVIIEDLRKEKSK